MDKFLNLVQTWLISSCGDGTYNSRLYQGTFAELAREMTKEEFFEPDWEDEQTKETVAFWLDWDTNWNFDTDSGPYECQLDGEQFWIRASLVTNP